MRHILHELNQLERGGVERVVLTLATFDKENEHSVITYKDGPMRKDLEAAGVDIIVAPENPGEGLNLTTDLIHTHTGGAPSRIASELGGSFPMIETIHSPVKSAVRRELVLQKVGVSKVVSRLNPGAITIHNGIDMNRFIPPDRLSKAGARLKLGLDPHRIVIGRIGRVARDKYLEEFLLACRDIQQTIDCDVVIAGPEGADDMGYIGRVKLMAACLPVRNVKFVGDSDPTQVVPAFDVFLYPSRDEGFGLVYIEAMAMGVPVVTYQTELSIELLGGHAVLTGPTVHDLAIGIERALDKNVGGAMAESGPSYADEFYSAELMALKYHALYEEKIKCQPSPTVSEAESRSPAEVPSS